MRFEQAGPAVAADLADLGLEFALIGGFAVSIRTVPRFTQDIDLAVAVADDRQAEGAVHGFVGKGYAVLALIEQAALGRVATVRLESPSGAWIVDLLFASSGIEPEIASVAEPMEIVPGVTLPVARVGHLIALKLLARDDEARPQDAADLRALLEVANESDLKMAHEAVELIEARGYARGRDLKVHLQDLIDGG
jgi:predicted nucleotidyltransferase